MSNLIRKSVTFTADDINAVLNGRKTQFRIMLGEKLGDIPAGNIDYMGFQANEYGLNERRIYLYNCALGTYGDKLIVKEDHRPIGIRWDDGEVLIEYRDGSKIWHHFLSDEEFEENPNDDYPMEIIKELEERKVPSISKNGQTVYDFSDPANLPHWRSADVMPDFASRLTIKIESIWAENVQDITSENAHAEGCPYSPVNNCFKVNQPLAKRNAISWFAESWNSTHGEGSYQSNPAVVVIEFTRIGTPL